MGPYAVNTERLVYVPMRDGVRLAVDLYTPAEPGNYPGIVFRTPYGRYPNDDGEFYASHGFAVLCADARGTGSSEGNYTYYNIEEGLYDGYDLCEFLAHHDTCNGELGSIGFSATGIYQILMASTKPPWLKCFCPGHYPLDFYEDQWYPGGVFRPGSRLGWIAGVNGGVSRQCVYRGCDDGEFSPESQEILDQLFVDRFADNEAALREGRLESDWYLKYAQNPVRNGVWDVIDLTERLRDITIPGLHFGLNYDHFGRGSLNGYQLHANAEGFCFEPGSLSVGEAPEEFRARALTLKFLKRHLQPECQEAPDPTPVRMFVSGINTWRAFESLPKTQENIFYLDDNNALTGNNKGTASVSLKHDPDCVVRTVDPIRPYAAFEEQEAVVVFTSEMFDEPQMCFGPSQLHLRVKTGMPDANILVRLCSVNNEDESTQLNFGALKLSLRESRSTPSDVPQDEWFDVCVEIWPLAHQFNKGDRVRIAMSLSDYPFFETSPHGGTLDIQLGEGTRLVLPVVS